VTGKHRRHNDFWDKFQATAKAGRAFEEGTPEEDARQLLHDNQERLTRMWASVEGDFPPGMAVDIARKVRLLAGLPPTAADELAGLAAERWTSAADAASAAVFSDSRARIERADGHQRWADRTTRLADGARAAATDIARVAELVTSMLPRPAGEQSFLVAWMRHHMPEQRRARLEWVDNLAPVRALEALHVLLSAGIDDAGLATAALLLPGFAGDTSSLAAVTRGVLQQYPPPPAKQAGTPIAFRGSRFPHTVFGEAHANDRAWSEE
jgi:hypothetical protein